MDTRSFINEQGLREKIEQGEQEKVLKLLAEHLKPQAGKRWEKLWYSEITDLRTRWAENERERQSYRTEDKYSVERNLITRRLTQILGEMENPNPLLMIERAVVGYKISGNYLLAANIGLALLAVIAMGTFIWINFVPKTNGEIDKKQCWIRTGHQTRLFHSPEFMPVEITNLPSLMEYQVLDISIEELSGRPFFKIEYKENATGWVNDFSLDYIAGQCLEKTPSKEEAPATPKTYKLIFDYIDLSLGPVTSAQRNYKLVFWAKSKDKEVKVHIPGRLGDYVQGLGEDRIIELENAEIAGVLNGEPCVFYFGMDGSAERAATNQAAKYLRGDFTLMPEITPGNSEHSSAPGPWAFSVGYRFVEE